MNKTNKYCVFPPQTGLLLLFYFDSFSSYRWIFFANPSRSFSSFAAFFYRPFLFAISSLNTANCCLIKCSKKVFIFQNSSKMPKTSVRNGVGICGNRRRNGWQTFREDLMTSLVKLKIKASKIGGMVTVMTRKRNLFIFNYFGTESASSS